MAFTFDRSEPGFWLSGLAHVGLLAAGLVAFTATKLPDAQEGIPVEVITDNQFSEITRGEITAAKVQPTPAPRAERIADANVQRAPGEAKDDVPAPPKRPAEVQIADEEVAPAPPPPKPAEVATPEPPPMPPARPDRQEAARAEAAAKAETAAKAEAAARADAAARAEAAKSEAMKLAQREQAEEQAAAEKAASDKARADARAKAKAEADAKAELDRKIKEADAKAKAEERAEADAKAKREADRKKVADAKAKAKAEAEAKARRQAETADKFDPGDISRLLASKEAARSSGSTGREVQKTASLGTETGNAARLNPSQRDQIAGLIREQLIKCWQPPIAVQSAARPPTATIRLGLRQDGSLSTEPAVMNSSSDPLFRPVADSALRATRRCAPLRIPAQFAPFYQDWKDLVVDFDPREIG